MADCMRGATLWRVEYQYADSWGGGQRVDYVRTENRYKDEKGTQLFSGNDNFSQEGATMTGPRYSRRGMLGSAITGLLSLFLPGKRAEGVVLPRARRCNRPALGADITSFSYESDGRITWVTPPDGLTISTYDRESRLIAVADGTDQTMTYVWDQDRRHVSGL